MDRDTWERMLGFFGRAIVGAFVVAMFFGAAVTYVFFTIMN